MAAIFSYEPRTGRLVGSAAGQHFSLLAQETRRQHAPDVLKVWGKEQELRPGKWTPWDHSFETPGHSSPGQRSLRLSILTEADRVHLAASGGQAMKDCLRARQGTVVIAESDQGACLVHGWPPCRSARCLVVPHGFAELVRAVARAGM